MKAVTARQSMSLFVAALLCFALLLMGCSAGSVRETGGADDDAPATSAPAPDEADDADAGSKIGNTGGRDDDTDDAGETDDADDNDDADDGDEAETDPWAVVGSAFNSGEEDELFTLDCPPGGEFRIVWGTDIYTDDSSVCTAAVHAGLITAEEGGEVMWELVPGEEEYEGSTRNGVTTEPYGAWGGSFVFVEED